MNTWWDKAKCKGVPTEVFFPRSVNPRTIRYAMSYCEVCPVRYECLDEAIETQASYDSGIRGGTTARQRNSIRSDVHHSRVGGAQAAKFLAELAA